MKRRMKELDEFNKRLYLERNQEERRKYLFEIGEYFKKQKEIEERKRTGGQYES